MPLVYLCVAAVALAIPYLFSAPEAGIWFVLLALPWSFLGVFVLDAIDPALTDTLGPAPGIVGALVNATLLHWILRGSKRRRKAQPLA